MSIIRLIPDLLLLGGGVEDGQADSDSEAGASAGALAAASDSDSADSSGCILLYGGTREFCAKILFKIRIRCSRGSSLGFGGLPNPPVCQPLTMAGVGSAFSLAIYSTQAS